MCQNACRKIIFPLLSNDIVVLWRYVLLDDRVVDLRVPSNQARAFLRRGRQPEEPENFACQDSGVSQIFYTNHL